MSVAASECLLAVYALLSAPIGAFPWRFAHICTRNDPSGGLGIAYPWRMSTQSPRSCAYQGPLSPNLCPLCGQNNACAQAAGGPVNAPCWCHGVTFSTALLARVPEMQRGIACICAACATAGTPFSGP
ncbi:cysteine-rich CWC family protein [Aquabacterium sp.]|uniref:cysteine-rich CWC family protein n=1 Tax=Aquabacterium sp. TaxID=1872578 RepID=UPI0027B8B65F|nr:cysteine-rich CWC family protein [Aquabacterium sp.]